jgi:hypothetical protein
MTMPPDAQKSEDGNWWWDGNQWQPVHGAQTASAGDQTHTAQQDQPMDWSQFPELARVIQYGQDVDTYLQDLGVDPSKITDDEPYANV